MKNYCPGEKGGILTGHDNRCGLLLGGGGVLCGIEKYSQVIAQQLS